MPDPVLEAEGHVAGLDAGPAEAVGDGIGLQFGELAEAVDAEADQRVRHRAAVVAGFDPADQDGDGQTG